MNAPNKSGWKPEMQIAEDGLPNGPVTTTGNRALMLEEPLLFEIGHAETTGVDLPAIDPAAPNRLGGLQRAEPIGLVGLTEPETVRHYTRLSRQNYGIDLGFFPLGSCTMTRPSSSRRVSGQMMRTLAERPSSPMLKCCV